MRGVRWVSLLLGSVFLLLQGCISPLSVPVGDPGKSRVDADLTGIWFSGMSKEESIQGGIVIVEPYDRRTWLTHVYGLVGGPEIDEDEQPSPSRDLSDFLVRAKGIELEIDQLAVFKTWITLLGGETFAVLEQKGAPSTQRVFGPSGWWVVKIEFPDPNTMTTLLIDVTFEGLGRVDSSREAEAIIREHARNPKLYDSGDGDREAGVWRRVKPADYDRVAKLLKAIEL